MKSKNPLVSLTLIIGVSVSFVLLIAGLAQSILHPVDLLGTAPTPREAMDGVRQGDAAATITLGILALMLTPFARVVMMVYEFARAREGPFVAISIVVLCLLFTSIAIGMR